MFTQTLFWFWNLEIQNTCQTFTPNTIGASPGGFVWVVINQQRKCIARNDSNKMGLVLVQSFVKVVRQTCVTSAKQKFLIWILLLCQCYDMENFFFFFFLITCFQHYYLFGIWYIIDIFNYKFLSRSIFLTAAWTPKVNLSLIISLLFSLLTRSFM